MLFFVSSCKKDSSGNQVIPSSSTPKQLGLYEADSSIYRELDIMVAKIGTQAVDFNLVFDTGSGGMVIDAHGIVPSSMITDAGFSFSGDSTVVDGITITNQTSMVEYGDDNNTISKVYGNLAYANVTIGDSNGTIVVKRLPFFLYFKSVDGKGNPINPHEFDVMGVSSEYDITFSNGVYITSPFSYYNVGTSLKRGFKMAALGAGNFSLSGTSVPDVITLGLTQSDLGNSGFKTTQLVFVGGQGYIPVISGSIGLVNDNVPAEMIFDTGTEPYTYIEDPNAPSGIFVLQPNNRVSIQTSTGFNYGYTVTAKDNLTVVENPNYSGSSISVISLDFFLQNEYFLDFDDHVVGLKSN
ncbi:MAG TPA: hypothetical protein VHC47_07470 [Mucilaginibacter sp.]|nr:hypothetical protein [Mucilaginibacter sp.]